ncbi:MAG: hypothetical protein V1706_01255 [Pseudomonadota bacterium]
MQQKKVLRFRKSSPRTEIKARGTGCVLCFDGRKYNSVPVRRASSVIIFPAPPDDEAEK